MSGKFLLDTNIVIACLGGERNATDRINDADEFYINSTILGEMLYGAYNSGTVEVNVQRVYEFLANARLLTCDEYTADVYGKTKATLRRKGRPIPDNDIWIAASAQQHSLTLVTRDIHFDEVDGLTLAQW